MPADNLPDNLESLLLDDQMGLLEPADRDRLERALAGDPTLQAKRDRLARTLGPLDAWTSQESLAARFCRIAQCVDLSCQRTSRSVRT